MKNYFVTSLLLCLIAASVAFSQVPASQDTIVIPGGVENMGSIETTINGDTLNGARINPDRVYKLEKDVMYFIQSRIQFGGGNDTSATLNIVGEKGGNKPVILTSPKEGQGAPRHNIHGSLTVKNVYWPATTIDNQGTPLFTLLNNDTELRLEGLVTEGCISGDLIVLSMSEPVNAFIKDCYFRDNSQFDNSWNFAVLARSGFAFDTLWVENTTVSNSGLTFFGRGVCKFFYFNHNTIVNTPKYAIWYEQYEEAYITNNIFINCNWQGECYATYHTQLNSQVKDSVDGHYAGITNIAPVDEVNWETNFGYAPVQEDVKWLSSNNVHFTSPFLNKYYAGDYNDVADYPISNRSWVLPPGGTVPTEVENVPPTFLNSWTLEMIENYENIIADNNYDNTVDPDVNTKSIPDQETGDVWAKKAMKDYGVLPLSENWTDEDKLIMAFGDRNPTTVPGIETEDGAGFRNVRDLVEDFSYNADLSSTIDGRVLGSLQWFEGELENYDSEAALAEVKTYFDNSKTGIEKIDATPVGFSLEQNYPNPFNPSTTINYSLPKVTDVKITIYNSLGAKVKTLVNSRQSAGTYNVTFDASSLASGVYFYQIKADNFQKINKMLYLK